MFTRTNKNLWRDERGAVLIYVTMISLVLLGMGVLSIDAARLLTLHTQLQNAADAASIAAANELDALAGAQDRARAAALNALNNYQNFGQSGLSTVAVASTDCATAASGVSCIGFLTSIPASDTEPIDYATQGATGDADSHFAEVRVVPETLDVYFAVVQGVSSTAQAWARSVAARIDVICNLPPVFMCNPVEQLGMTFNDLHGQQVRFDTAGGGFGPGNFGLLCPLDDPNCGAGTVRDYLGSKFNGLCLATYTELPTKPGVNSGMVMAAINSRLDYFPAQTTSAVPVNWRDLEEFAPAANVSQGGVLPNPPGMNKCEYKYNDASIQAVAAQSTDPSMPGEAMGLPRDSNLLDPIDTAVFLGNGDWDYAEYFRINHGGDGTPGWRPVGWSSDFLGNIDLSPTRYQTYRYEIEHDDPMDGSTEPDQVVEPEQGVWANGADLVTDPPAAQTVEDGGVQCHNFPAADTESILPETDAESILNGVHDDRRIMTFASVDCIAAGVPSGRSAIVPDEIVFGFLTEPAGPNGSAYFHLEIIVPATTLALEAVLGREIVQIYRR